MLLILKFNSIKKINENKKGSVKHGKLFALLHDHKLDMVLSTGSALITGGCVPAQGLVLARAINALTNKNIDEMKDDSLFYAMMFLVLAVGNGLFIFLKLWKFQKIGSVITTKM